MPKLGMENIRRRQVIDAVVRILETQGWRDLTIREVSDVAGISTGVVTHYFANKHSMVVDAIADQNQKLSRTINLIEQKTTSATQRLISVVDVMTMPQEWDLPHGNFWIALYGRLPFDLVIQGELQRLQRWMTERVGKIVAQGLQSGEFRTAHRPEDIASSFVILAFGQFVAAAAMPGELAPERCRKLLLDRLGDSLGVLFDHGRRLTSVQG